MRHCLASLYVIQNPSDCSASCLDSMHKTGRRMLKACLVVCLSRCWCSCLFWLMCDEKYDLLIDVKDSASPSPIIGLQYDRFYFIVLVHIRFQNNYIILKCISCSLELSSLLLLTWKYHRLSCGRGVVCLATLMGCGRCGFLKMRARTIHL